MPHDKICECRKQTPILYVSKSDDSVPVPGFSHPGDAGMNICCNEDVVLLPGTSLTLSTGCRMKVPEGYVGMVCPRSGMASKYSVTVGNAPGVSDSGYLGELKVILMNHGKQEYKIQKGDKIAQLVIVPFVSPSIVLISDAQMDEFKTERGSQGFGSTGR